MALSLYINTPYGNKPSGGNLEKLMGIDREIPIVGNKGVWLICIEIPLGINTFPDKLGKVPIHKETFLKIPLEIMAVGV